MRSDVCPWLTPCGYTRKVRPHLPQRYLCTCTCWYTVSLSAFPTDWCIWTCLLPQPSYTHSLGSLISFGSTFGNNNCKRIADVLPLFSPLYFTPLLPLDEQSPHQPFHPALTRCPNVPPFPVLCHPSGTFSIGAIPISQAVRNCSHGWRQHCEQDRLLPYHNHRRSAAWVGLAKPR